MPEERREAIEVLQKQIEEKVMAIESARANNTQRSIEELLNV